MTKFVLTGSRLFDGEEFSAGRSVVVDNGKVVDIVKEGTVPAGAQPIELHGGILAPGFIDVQVNGGGGALFNRRQDVEMLRQIAASHRRFGTTGMLPTVITDAPGVLPKALTAVCEARQQVIPGILGIHIEGPFIDIARKGAHDERYIREMTDADINLIASADCGSVLVTLAPNRVELPVIAKLTAHGVTVSLGHSDAPYEVVLDAIDAGARSFTHLFNAMSQLNSREPGMVGAALLAPDAYIGIIADGFHVHPAALRLALASKNRAKFMLVTDAMSSAAGGPDDFELQGRKVRLKNGRLQMKDGTLAGSHLTMIEAVRYCIRELGVSLPEALIMASRAPAEMLRLDKLYGRIAPGYAADLVHIDDDLNVMHTWIGGN